MFGFCSKLSPLISRSFFHSTNHTHLHGLASLGTRGSPMEQRSGEAGGSKGSYQVTENFDAGNEYPVQDGHEDSWGGSKDDKCDMMRLGKKQEFKRNIRLLSALGFVSVYMATWEFVLVSLAVGFTNGGFAGLFWCFITTVTCYSTIILSLAESQLVVEIYPNQC